ncbi:hypothetical protein ACFYY8_20410 [Streptosporangium sp. NPDC001559]|uniref:hypothetical protein n=1 Tax=Streptosporangium sp. NPDC001559 TaxID=3366187 RepID=UPI0036ECA9A4
MRAAAWQGSRLSVKNSQTVCLEDLDVPDVTFVCPDLITFFHLDELGHHRDDIEVFPRFCEDAALYRRLRGGSPKADRRHTFSAAET